MNNATYLKEPGILYDMLFALKLRFNGERAYLPLRTGNLSYEEDEKFYHKIIDKFSDISDLLFPLFYYDSEQDIKTAIFTYVYDYIDLTTDGLIEHFYESLHDVDRLKRVVYTTYISPHCPDVFDKAAILSLKKDIFSSPLPDGFKIHLYDFFVFGEDQIEEIVTAFRAAEKLCKKYHEQHKREIQEYANNFGDNQIEILNQWYSQELSQYKNIHISYCTLFRQAMVHYKYDKIWLSIVSLNTYQNVFLLEEKSPVNLYELGNILNDDQRLRILNMLAKEEMYCAQIARKLGLKNNSTLYHLVIMEREGILLSEKSSKDGKRIYYRININYINALKKLLEVKFSGVQNNENSQKKLEEPFRSNR